MKEYLKSIFKNPQKEYRNKYKNDSYSQCGEDMIVDYVFRLREIDRPSFIDIGAYHPYYLNNTAFFYHRGCRGTNIEANPDLIHSFLKYRPEDINLNVGISDRSGELDFFIMKDNTLSTFSVREADLLVEAGKELEKVQKIQLSTIPDILNNHYNGLFPDFLSLDVEGMDFAILQSIHFESSFPKIICVEAAEYSTLGIGTKRIELINFLVAKGYYEYANTNLNAIMVKNEFWFI